MYNNLYHGRGRLTNQDCVYEGEFQRGDKNGYGEEYYPKTDITVKGYFK